MAMEDASDQAAAAAAAVASSSSRRKRARLDDDDGGGRGASVSLGEVRDEDGPAYDDQRDPPGAQDARDALFQDLVRRESSRTWRTRRRIDYSSSSSGDDDEDDDDDVNDVMFLGGINDDDASDDDYDLSEDELEEEINMLEGLREYEDMDELEDVGGQGNLSNDRVQAPTLVASLLLTTSHLNVKPKTLDVYRQVLKPLHTVLSVCRGVSPASIQALIIQDNLQLRLPELKAIILCLAILGNRTRRSACRAVIKVNHRLLRDPTAAGIVTLPLSPPSIVRRVDQKGKGGFVVKPNTIRDYWIRLNRVLAAYGHAGISSQWRAELGIWRNDLRLSKEVERIDPSTIDVDPTILSQKDRELSPRPEDHLSQAQKGKRKGKSLPLPAPRFQMGNNPDTAIPNSFRPTTLQQSLDELPDPAKALRMVIAFRCPACDLDCKTYPQLLFHWIAAACKKIKRSSKGKTNCAAARTGSTVAQEDHGLGTSASDTHSSTTSEVSAPPTLSHGPAYSNKMSLPDDSSPTQDGIDGVGHRNATDQMHQGTSHSSDTIGGGENNVDTTTGTDHVVVPADGVASASTSADVAVPDDSTPATATADRVWCAFCHCFYPTRGIKKEILAKHKDDCAYAWGIRSGYSQAINNDPILRTKASRQRPKKNTGVFPHALHAELYRPCAFTVPNFFALKAPASNATSSITWYFCPDCSGGRKPMPDKGKSTKGQLNPKKMYAVFRTATALAQHYVDHITVGGGRLGEKRLPLNQVYDPPWTCTYPACQYVAEDMHERVNHLSKEHMMPLLVDIKGKAARQDTLHADQLVQWWSVDHAIDVELCSDGLFLTRGKTDMQRGRRAVKQVEAATQPGAHPSDEDADGDTDTEVDWDQVLSN